MRDSPHRAPELGQRIWECSQLPPWGWGGAQAPSQGPGTLLSGEHYLQLPLTTSQAWAILFFQGWICCPWRWTFHQERPLVPEPKAALLVNLPDAASPGPTLQDSVQNRWLGTSFSQFETLSSSWREAPTIVCGQEPGCGTWLSRAHTSLYKKFP